MAREEGHFMDEPDIGSGEKTAGQRDVEADVRRVNGTVAGAPQAAGLHQTVDEQRYASQPPSGQEQQAQSAGAPGRVLQSGTHLARVVAVRQPDDTFEAQVYVRLTREPEVAETYIPAGIFATEAEAWTAAEQRAQRAFKEHEF